MVETIEWIYIIIGGVVLYINWCIDLHLIQHWIFKKIDKRRQEG